MKQLAVVTCVMFLLLKFKGFDCDNVKLLIPPSKYESTFGEPLYCGLSPSEIASLCSASSSSLSTPIKVSLVKAISSSPYILYSLSPASVFNFLDVLSSSPSLLKSAEPSNLASLIETLCASPSLLKTAPSSTVINFLNAITICPKTISALPPPTLIRFLSKLYAETPGVLYDLPPVVRVSLIDVILSPKVLSTLKPTEIIFLINFFVSFECALIELPPNDVIELLKTIASCPTNLNNIPTSQIISLLYRVFKSAPFLFDSIPADVINTLLTPIKLSVCSQSPTTFVNLAIALSSSPLINAIDNSILSCLLIAISPPSVLSTVPPESLIKLLTEISLSDELMKTIEPEVIIKILFSIKSISPTMICDIPPSVRSTYVINLTAAKVTDALSINKIVKLIDTLSDSACFLKGLPSSSINLIINLLISKETVLSLVPLKNIVALIHYITVLSPFLAREMPPETITKLLLPLISTSPLSSLEPCCYEQLLSCVSNSPILLNIISPEQIVSILTAFNPSAGNTKDALIDIYVNILIQIFISPTLLPKIPLDVLLNLLMKIENNSPSALCLIPSFAITTFLDFLGNDPGTLVSLSPLDVKNLLIILTRTPCFFTQIPAKIFNALLDLVAASDAALYNISPAIKIDLFYSVYSLLPSMFYSLSAKTLGEIADSFGSLETLSALPPDRLGQLATVVAECPLLASATDPATATNLLNALSASPPALAALAPRVVVGLATWASSSSTLTCYVHFLKALSAAAPRTLALVPSSVLGPLASAGEDGVAGLKSSADVECLADALLDAPELLAGLPPATAADLLTAVSKTFTTVPRAKTVVLLVAMRTVTPCSLHAVPTPVLTDLLDTIASGAGLGGLPPRLVTGLAAVLSSSTCLMSAASKAALNDLLDHLSTTPRAAVTCDALAQFLVTLSLTPSVLPRARTSLIVSLLSKAFSGPADVAPTVPPAAICALLEPLGDDARAVFDLEPTDVASLISAAACSQRILNAIVGAPLDALMSRAASSPRLLSFVSPSLITSFLTAIARSPDALDSVRPNTLLGLFVTAASCRPAALSALSPSAVTALLSAFKSDTAVASLPPPSVNSFACLLLAFPGLWAALPLDALAALLRLLCSDPVVLRALPSCTVARLLAALSSVPSLLRALPPGLLATFLSATSVASPNFLCSLPSEVVAALFQATAADPAALASSTPASVASLLSALNRSPGLVFAVPTPVLVAFFTYLTSHQDLLKDTPRCDLLNVVHSIRSPTAAVAAVPQVQSRGPPSSYDRYDGDFVSFLSLRSPTLGNFVDVNGENVLDRLTTELCRPSADAVSSPNKCTMIYSVPNVADPDEDGLDPPIDLMPRPKLIIPKNAKGATVYVFKKDDKTSPSDNAAGAGREKYTEIASGN